MDKSKSLGNLTAFLEDICKEHNVPALSVAVWHNNQLYQAATGILNLDTGVAATADSLFQIGSISKVFTASLIMQLVDEGRVDLDASVKKYLRDFQVADRALTSEVTVGQLLDHTNGIAGDFLPNTSYTEENAIARYVDRCNLLPKVHELGTRHSYSNAAYSIAGRLIEVVLGCSWFDAIAERIFEPLGMKHAIAHPSQVLRHRAAMGHTPKPGQPDTLELAPDCYFPLGWAPGGATISLSAADLIKFAKAHLNEGRSELGQAWLSPASVNAMQTPRIQLPKDAYSFADHWGLGWQLLHRPNTPQVVGHGGVVIGQTSLMHMVPEQNLAIAVLQNRVKPSALYAVAETLFQELANIDLTEKPPLSNSHEDLQRFQGTFETIGIKLAIRLKGNELSVKASLTLKTIKTFTYLLKAINDTCFAAYSETGERESNVVFQDFDNEGRPTSLYSQFRQFNRAPSQ